MDALCLPLTLHMQNEGYTKIDYQKLGTRVSKYAMFEI